MAMQEAVLDLVKRIPIGRVTTYGEIANALGNRKLARAVGRILNRNIRPIEIPCHRVVRFDGSIGGYNRGIEEKVNLLRKEGIQIRNGKILDFERVFFRVSS